MSGTDPTPSHRVPRTLPSLRVACGDYQCPRRRAPCAFAGGQGVVYRCHARTRLVRAFWSCRCGVDRHLLEGRKIARHSAWAWARAGWGADVRRRNGRCAATNLRALPRGIAQPPLPSYIRAGGRTGEHAAAGAGIQGTGVVADGSSGRSYQGCCC